MINNKILKDNIKQKALELGFCAVGFAKAEALYKESERLKNWLKKGFDADMQWIQKGFEKRKNVEFIVENAKTVISLAYNYYIPNGQKENEPKISIYAQGLDYHNILKEKLKIITDYLQQHKPESISKFYTDDGPVMDKAWAVKAGIGWQGKHTNVINPDYGSWIFLSEIISNIDFEEYDLPIEDMCGTCNICVQACPTKAITNDYELNSNLCISYLTIENKDEIPEYLDLDGWIYGCDICQEVCPYNKNDKTTTEVQFHPINLLSERRTDALNSITEDEFKKIFKHSPIKRTKYSGWKRNLGKYLKDKAI